MADFSKNTKEVYSSVRTLQNSIPNTPYELQLVWLFELLMIRAFLILCKQGSAFIRDGQSPNTLCLFERDCYHGFPSRYERTVQTLHKYRNAFVHSGYIAATVYFDRLLTMEDKLKELATFVKVELDSDDMIFRKVSF